jgi:AraC-like DNA-binding protein
MSAIFHNLLATTLSNNANLKQILFASDHLTPPLLSYQVNFPRLEIVINGQYRNQIESTEQEIINVTLVTGDVLYIPPNCWNKPFWDKDCTVLSLLFGRKQVGFSLVSKKKNEKGFYNIRKHSVQNRTGHAIDHIIDALNSLAFESSKRPMDKYLLLSLISYSQTMISAQANSAKKHSEDLYQGICIYIQEHFQALITRTMIANHFNISANHLSRLFRQQGHMTLSDYIIWVRLDRAKFMLKKYPFKLNEIATRCGFQDVNYFFRVFKNKTGKTPTEYRNTD